MEFLGGQWGKRMQEAQHGVSSWHALAKSFTKDTCRDSPVLNHAPEQSVALANFLCKQVLGGKFTLRALNTQCLGWQHFSGNKSTMCSSHWVSTWMLPSTYYFKTKLQQYLKMSNIVYKSSMLWRAYGSRKSLPRNVTELYFQPNCSMW